MCKPVSGLARFQCLRDDVILYPQLLNLPLPGFIYI